MQLQALLPATPSNVSKRRCCALPADHPLWVDVWKAYALASPTARDAALATAVQLHGNVLACDEVREHMHRHRPEQPPVGGWFRRRAQEEAVLLRDRDARILAYVGQAGPVSVWEVADTFFETVTQRSRRKAAARTLLRLARRGFLLRVELDYEIGHATPRQGYYLTLFGEAALLALRGDDVEGEPANGDLALKPLRTKADAAGHPVQHDLSQGLVAARLRHDADERPSRELAVRSGVRRLSLVMRPENMRSAKQLCMGHRVPAYYIGDVREKEAHANLTPDGFLALGVREEGALDCLLGLFVEFDSGNVAVAPAAEQLWQYLALAASGAPARRLPDFAVPGYTLPLLFVTQHRSTLRGHAIPKAATELDTRRVHALADAFRARIVKVRWEDATMAACPLPPLFLATHGELQQYGWDCPVLSLHQVGNERWPLLRALLRDAGPLLQAARLGAGDVARIDLSGASGVVGGNRTALTRAQHQERELLAAAQQRALDELDEVTYEARVGGAA